MTNGPDEAGPAPALPSEQPEPAYESKQDEPSGIRAADPRTLEAADEEDADPLASLPADFAAFSLTQTHPSGDAKAGASSSSRSKDARMCIYGDKCPYGPGRCLRTRRVRIEAAAGALVAARVQDEAATPTVPSRTASTRTRSAWAARSLCV